MIDFLINTSHVAKKANMNKTTEICSVKPLTQNSFMDFMCTGKISKRVHQKLIKYKLIRVKYQNMVINCKC